MDDGDGVLGEDGRLLAVGAQIALAEVPGLVRAFGGAAFPAHIDRPSFSLLGVLGLWDPDLGFPVAELSTLPAGVCMPARFGGLRFVSNSDAHYLEQVWGAEHALDLPHRSAAAVIGWLNGTVQSG